MGERWRRIIGCRDVFGRRSTVRVSCEDNGEILLATPPGECAVLNERSACAAGRALADASCEQALAALKQNTSDTPSDTPGDVGDTTSSRHEEQR